MSTKFYLGTRKGLIQVERLERGWEITRTSFLGVSVPMLLPDARDGRLIAAVEHGHYGGKLHASSDDGLTWQGIAVPVFPARADDEPEIICPMSQKPIPQSLEKIWALEAGGPDEPGVLWCGTVPGALFKSTVGRSLRDCGTELNAKNGSAAAWTGRAFIQSVSILATVSM